MTDKPKHTINSSTIVDADPDSVWTELRDVTRMVKIVFGDTVGNVEWIEGGTPERVPSRYDFTMPPSDDVAHQEIVGRDELARSVTYRSLDRVLCVADYLGHYRVVPVTSDPDRCIVEWTREFTVTDDAQPEVLDAVINMMENQINTLREYFAAPRQA